MKSKQKGQILVMTILLKLIIVTSFLLFSELSQAAQCFSLRDTYWSESQQLNVYRYEDRGLASSGCLETVVLDSAEYAKLELLEQQNNQVFQITSIDIAESFTWGFGTYISFWFLGFAVKNARMVIRKA